MSQLNAIYSQGLVLLTRREHSRRELQAKLRVKFSGDHAEIEAVLDKLKADGYQSDVRFAETFVSSRSQRGIGIVRLRQELKRKGLADLIISEVLRDLAETDNPFETTLIYRTWEKKFKNFTDNTVALARQKRFLQYRGFEIDQINSLMGYLRERFINSSN